MGWFDRSPAIGGAGNFDPMPAAPLVEREPLIEEFLGGLGDEYAGMDRAAVLGALEERYLDALGAAHPVETDEDFESYMAMASGERPYVPVWEPMQREAVMNLYREGGMPAVLERFSALRDEDGNPINHGYTEDGDLGWVGAGDLAEHLLPPGARPVMEAHRQYEYFKRLMDEERPLERADIAIGKHGGGNYMRTGDANWFGGPATDGGPGRHAGPMYYGAQESPAMTNLAMNPHKPTVTGMFGAMDIIPKAIAYTAESGGPVEGLTRTVDRIRSIMADDALTEMPTSREHGTSYWSQAADTGRARQALSDAEPDEGQEGLQTLGVPDALNHPLLGISYDVGRNLLDPSPIWGTGPDILMDAGEAAAKQGVKRGWGHIAKQAPKNVAYDAGTDVATQAPFLAQTGTPGIQGTPAERHETTRKGEDFLSKRAPASQGGGMWGTWTQRGNHFRDVLKEATEPMQRMAATNKHIREDMHNEAMRRWEDEQQQKKQTNVGGW